MKTTVTAVYALLSLSLPSSISAQMKMLGFDAKTGEGTRSNWLIGNWKDLKSNDIFGRLRKEIDKLPARNRSVTQRSIEQWLSDSKRQFEQMRDWESFYKWLSLCGRYPNVGRKDTVYIDRYLFEFQSPNCYEFARAAFIYCGNVHTTSLNFPKDFDQRFRPYTEGDWLLIESMVRLYSHGSSTKKETQWWAWNEAKKLSEKMSDGMYGFGRLRVEASVPLMTTSIKFLDQEVDFIDKLMTGNYFSTADVKKLANTKNFFLTVKKRMQKKGAP